MMLTASVLITQLVLWSSSLTCAQTITRTAEASHPTDEPEWTSSETFTSAVLDSHNAYRSDHDASDLTWNETLAESSQEYLDSEGSDENECPDFEHSDSPYGENLAIGHRNATQAVEAWGDERDIYDFDDQGFDEETGHFTQMVWQDTTDVGCARKLCLDDDRDIEGWYLVCHYWPVGNVQDQFEEQVETGDYDGPPDDDDDSAASTTATARAMLLLVGTGIAAWLAL